MYLNYKGKSGNDQYFTLTFPKNKGHLSVGADADMTVYDYATQEPKASFVAGRKVLWDGKVVAKGATVICTERGQKAIQARGMKAIVVDPGKQVERVKAL